MPIVIGLVGDLRNTFLEEDAPDIVPEGTHTVGSTGRVDPLPGTRESAEDHGISDLLVEEVDAEMLLYAREIKDAVMAVDSLALELLEDRAHRLDREEHRVQEVGLVSVGELDEANLPLDEGERLLRAEGLRPGGRERLDVHGDVVDGL